MTFRVALEKYDLQSGYIGQSAAKYQTTEQRDQKLSVFKTLKLTRDFLGGRSEALYIQNAKNLAERVIKKETDRGSHFFRDLFLRIANFFTGNGFRTNLEVAQEILEQIQAIAKDSFDSNPQAPGFQGVDFWKAMCSNRLWNILVHCDKKLAIVKAIYEKFVQKQVPNTIQTEKGIPKKIHIIWISKQGVNNTVPERVHKVAETWRKLNPNSEVKIWDDQAVKTFDWKFGRKEAFQMAQTCAEKADILRAQILNNIGGFYVDADMVCLKTFEDLMCREDIDFVVGQELNYRYRFSFDDMLFAGNALIGSAKGSKVAEGYARDCKSEEEAPGVGILDRTGPILLTQKVREALDSGDEKCLVLPCSYFYPIPYGGNYERYTFRQIEERFAQPETMAAHLWDGSWT